MRGTSSSSTGVSVGIFQLNLPASLPGLDLASESHAAASEFRHRRVEFIHVEHDSVPPPRFAGNDHPQAAAIPSCRGRSRANARRHVSRWQTSAPISEGAGSRSSSTRSRIEKRRRASDAAHSCSRSSFRRYRLARSAQACGQAHRAIARSSPRTGRGARTAFVRSTALKSEARISCRRNLRCTIVCDACPVCARRTETPHGAPVDPVRAIS